MSTNSDNPSLNLNGSDCDTLRELLPAYVIGATTAEETQQIQALLPLCPEVASDLALYGTLAEGLSTRVESVAPPSHARKALLDRVAAQESAFKPHSSKIVPFENPSTGSKRFAWGAVAAACALLLATNAYWLTHVNNLEADFASLQQDKQTIVTLLNAERLQRITLQSTTNTEMLARVFWNPETLNGTFYTDRLPTLDEAHTYQVWLIKGDEPISAGIFGVDSYGEGLLTFTPHEDLHSFAAIAISIEPTGGSPAPTTDPMAVGEIATS